MPNTQPLDLALCDALLQRYQPDIDAMTGKGWDHSNSAILSGMAKAFVRHHKPEHLEYIRRFVDRFVAEDGSVSHLSDTLDEMHPGVLCLFMFEQTGQEKYRQAARIMRDHFLGTPDKPSAFRRTTEGGYWHKNMEKYRNVMTVDGIYMIYPFLAQYAARFGDDEALATVVRQILMISERSFNTTSGLPYHAWHAEKNFPWANPITGTSSQFWSRASGWFAMGLVDVLDAMPADHAGRATLLFLLRSLAEGVARHQHADGLWYQVLDHAGKAGNFPESSATGMLVYALQKGVRTGLLPQQYASNASRGWQALQTHIAYFSDGGPQVRSVAPAMGVQVDYAAYIGIRPVEVPCAQGVQHPHGYIGALMAAAEMA
ncbi:glycoside hydrolase family 88 protein [Uliginosibacterium sp. H3]|uniref:Glycoside hydrolase family 88 protein n=1 Tax=Uliginosibacterium silvisoli TaxID=3114758 RepID=A0ABU6JY41_9RHOO|nr:glycoside hydrolase family 88 protein [Uliginosibacterium sp. H3]